MKEIQLTRGKVALVDDDDYEALSKHRWCADRHRNTWYAVRRKSKPEGLVRVYMHRELVVADGDIDHVDRNGLNNQRHNLRPCTRSQNMKNCTKKAGATSRYVGVYKMRGKHHEKRKKKWAADIRRGNKTHRIGYYDTEIEAAIARERAVLESGDSFLRLNFPEVV